ncbi:MAG: histidine phosphatase family protein [Cellvibrionaceae bacterium]|nr:histidine phosphatase family protein [Cellvibrionaceae bacterium]
MVAPRLYFLRHGQTDWNRLGLLQGRLDVPLNGRGRAQLQSLTPLLKQLPIEQVHCSSLLRARQSCQALGLTQTPSYNPCWSELSLAQQQAQLSPGLKALLAHNWQRLWAGLGRGGLLVSHGSLFEAWCLVLGQTPISLDNGALLSMAIDGRYHFIHPGFSF